MSIEDPSLLSDIGRLNNARRIFSSLEDVTKYSKCYRSDDMRDVLNLIKLRIVDAHPTEVAAVTLKLISCYRQSIPLEGKSQIKDFEEYARRLSDAFMPYPLVITREAVDAATGIPSKHPYWPKPFDIVKFCESKVTSTNVVKLMAERHLAERVRRDKEKQEEKAPPTEEQKLRVREIVVRMHNDIAANRFLPDGSVDHLQRDWEL